MSSSRASTHRSHRPARQGTVGLMLVTSILVFAGCWAIPATGAAPAKSTAAAVVTSAAVAKCPHGTAAGVTSKEITVAATVIDISGGSVNNATYGVPSAADQEADWKLVADHINKTGGIGCRKVVLDLYPVNSFDAS